MRGVVTLPHGTGRVVRILVFAGADGVSQAEEAGADFVGGEDLAARDSREAGSILMSFSPHRI